MLEQLQRRGIEPLQVIEEQRQWVIWCGERAEEPSEHPLKSVLCLSRRKVRNGRLSPDQELKLGNEVDDELTVRADCLAQRILPAAEIGIALAKDRANERLKSLCESGVRDVAFVLVELAGGKQATRWDQHLVQFVHHRRLADPRITGHQHELGCAVGYDAVE